jgi:toxin ParE1/3/4
VKAAAFSPRARRELLAATRWIARDNPAAANALLEAVANAGERIARHPKFGRLRPDLIEEPYRFVTLTGFPYVIVYNAERKPPLIVHILHGARNLRQILKNK